MRKIKTMADVERIQRRNNIILGVIMIFLLTASSVGYSLMSADEERKNSVSENGFDFVRDGGIWKLSIGGDSFGFVNLPSEVSDVDVNLSVEFGMYSGQPLYFVNPGEGAGEVLNNFGNYVLRYQEACLQQDENELGNLTSKSNESEVVCNGDLPIKDCNSNLIIFEVGNETRVYSEGKCVFIVGDVLRGSDAFLYKILGIN